MPAFLVVHDLRQRLAQSRLAQLPGFNKNIHVHDVFQIGLFWRTFVLLIILLLTSSLVWLVTFRNLDAESRSMQSARQIGSIITLTRTTLVNAENNYHSTLMKAIAEQEGIGIVPRHKHDISTPFLWTLGQKTLEGELQKRLGMGTLIRGSVNKERGLWVSFEAEGEKYWLKTNLAHTQMEGTNSIWLYWVAIAIGMSLAGAALIAGFINRPLKDLSTVAHQIAKGELPNVLNEGVITTEIRDVNHGFNQMADQLLKMEATRTILLAGISHDLRTPLARLRLETELSVFDENARKAMGSDIEHINAMLSKFLDYAKPHSMQLNPVQLAPLVNSAIRNASINAPDLHVQNDISTSIWVMADAVELGRVVTNLLENARRYGKSAFQEEVPADGEHTRFQHKEHVWQNTVFSETVSERAQVYIQAKYQGDWVYFHLRDHGNGVPDDILSQLTNPFFRANQARSNVTGSGLGLAIVEKAIHAMNGQLKFSNATPHDKSLWKNAKTGLVVQIKLHAKK